MAFVSTQGGVSFAELLEQRARATKCRAGDVRSIHSNPQISEVARKRQKELREKARGLATA